MGTTAPRPRGRRPDLLRRYIRVHRLLGRLRGRRLEHGPDRLRDMLIVALVDEQGRLRRLGLWN